MIGGRTQRIGERVDVGKMLENTYATPSNASAVKARGAVRD